MIGDPHAHRRALLLGGLLLGSLTVVGRASQLQLMEREHWLARAAEQHARQHELPAPRGAIYDRDGVPLAVSQQAYRVSVAPRELQDRPAAARKLSASLGISARAARRAVEPARRWVVLPGVFGAPVREQLEGLQGIYFDLVLERFHPHGVLALELLGRISADGQALGGLELEFDSILRGRPGAAVVRRDALGEPIPGATVTVREPVPGQDLYLTLDFDLQEIAHEALREAVEETGSAGGDLILADPWTGEILAAASRQADGNPRWTAVTDPVEPGSTIKPFLVTALLAGRHVTMADSVYAEQGSWTQGGRTISDVHGYGWLTVHEALQYSSNVAMAKLAGRMPPAEQYAALRDFGFGTPTGVSYPSESGGLLRRPQQWSRYSQASLAIGYEVGVTPLQLLMAYACVANGGMLMEPRLVREVRSQGGKTVARFPARALRRVAPREVVGQVAAALVDVVRGGTARQASLETFPVAGKTGTARRARSGGYQAGAYTSTFAGYFPAVDPQLVFLVKLDRPKGAYYGGATAAPVTRETLAAALAARETPLDRGAIARGLPDTRDNGGAEQDPMSQKEGGTGTAAAPEPRVGAAVVAEPGIAPGEDAASRPGPFIFALDAGPPRRPAAAETPRPVPDVRGLPLRDAARRLHAQGFKLRVEGSGAVVSTRPAPGGSAEPGTVVTLRGEDGKR